MPAFDRRSISCTSSRSCTCTSLSPQDSVRVSSRPKRRAIWQQSFIFLPFWWMPFKLLILIHPSLLFRQRLHLAPKSRRLSSQVLPLRLTQRGSCTWVLDGSLMQVTSASASAPHTACPTCITSLGSSQSASLGYWAIDTGRKCIRVSHQRLARTS